MRRIALPLAAAALAATAPLALSAPGTAGLTKAPAAGDTSTGHQSHGKATRRTVRTAAAARTARAERRTRARRAKPVNLVLKGCVVEDAAGDGVSLDTLDGNAVMRRLMGDAGSLRAPLSPGTRVVLSEAAQMDHGEDGALGTIDDLWAGDRVVVRWRVARGTALDALPGAMRVVNRGPHDDCLPDAAEEPADDAGDGTPVEEPVVEEPVSGPLAPPAGGAGELRSDDDDDHAGDDCDEAEEAAQVDEGRGHHRRGRR